MISFLRGLDILDGDNPSIVDNEDEGLFHPYRKNVVGIKLGRLFENAVFMLQWWTNRA